MSTFKCKMCGGTLEIEPNETIATCEYCGTQQTLRSSMMSVVQICMTVQTISVEITSLTRPWASMKRS